MANPVKKDDEAFTKEQLAAVLSDDPETNEEAFEAAFEEFAGVDDTATVSPPAEGRKDEGQPLAGEPAVAPEKTEKTETTDQATSGEQSPGADEAAPDGAAEAKDIWADATPEQRAAFEAAQTDAKTHRNRASAQNRKIADLMSAPKPAAQPAADKDADTATTTEADKNWEQFDGEYPEVAGPVAARMDRQDKEIAALKSENADLKGRVTGITDVQEQDAINNEEALLVQRHPDWEQLTASDEFSAWLPDQPRYVQEGFARNGTAIVDGQEAASLIDLFKDDQAPAAEGQKPAKDTTTHGKATRRQRRLESAVQTESGQAGPGAGPPEGDFDAAFEHFAALP